MAISVGKAREAQPNHSMGVATMKFKFNKLALLVSGLFLTELVPAWAQETSNLGQITVTGAAEAPGGGMIQADDTPKARSSVSREAISKMGASSTAFQIIQSLPGVSAFDQDGTGLFGGTLRVRGYNANQMGLTLDGAPLNDSLNYSINIQEFADPENTCDVFLNQGSGDMEAPHVGASGGNVGISTCDPRDTLGGKFNLAFGSNRYNKEFVRFDSGKFANDRAKFFISMSQAGADKFKGSGSAKREHVDAKAVFDFGSGSYSKLAFLWNKMDNANYRTVSKADLARFGYGYDFGTTPPSHLTPGSGTAQNEATANAAILGNYQGFNNNPFENYQVSMVNHWQLSPQASVDVNPYYIYGYGTGGNQLTSVSEARGSNLLHGGIGDLNGDGDTLDTILGYGSNISQTNRFGVTTKANYQLGSHNLSGGLWLDRGISQQYSPFASIDSNGNTSDYWLTNSAQYLKYADGAPYNAGRNWYTRVDAHTVFLQDSFSLVNDRLNIQLGLKRQEVKRDFLNFASGLTVNSGGADYEVKQTFSNTLGNVGLRYQLTETQSVFLNLGQNARAPENTANTGLVQTAAASNYTTSIVNGALIARDSQGNIVPLRIGSPKVSPEKSNNIDLGYRYAGNRLTLSGSVFYIDFKDRIASQYDPVSALSTQFNVGASRTYGLELEAGYKMNDNWNMYGSLTHADSSMLDDKVAVRAANGTATTLQTSGKQMPDTPQWLASLSLQYTTGPFYASAQGRYVGQRYTTLVNDDSIGGYTLFDLGAGYRFNKTLFLQTPTIRFQLLNLFDRKYLSMTGPSGSSFTTNANATTGTNGAAIAAASAPLFYVGAPRTFQVSLSSDF